MNTDIEVLPADMRLSDYLRRPEHAGRLRHVVVSRHGRVAGVFRINTSLRRGLETGGGEVTLGDIASRHFVVVSEKRIVFDVIRRMWRKGAIMAVVAHGDRVPRAGDVAGVITKEDVADSVADSVSLYPR
jgi:CIC family chloride channel protein